MAHIVKLKKERARMVFKAIIKAWENGEKDFANHTPPERKLRPKMIAEGTREHRLWIFTAGHFSRSGQTADQVIGSVAYFAENFPHFLDPLAKRTRRQWKEFCRYMLPRFPFHEKERWIRLKSWITSLEILKFYGGDPINIFYSIDLTQPEEKIREEAIARLEDFPGVAQKIAQLIAQWFQEVDWHEMPEFWESFNQVKVSAADIWLMREMKQFDLIEDASSQNRDTISRPISDQIVEICIADGLDHRILIQALWHIGSRICALARKKKAQKRGSYCFHHCPASQFCTSIVPANKERAGRGDIPWDLAEPRLVLPLE